MAEEMISKKEVLKLTGISYGQLYRWKRKGLIPEAWFVRRSTFTGQETFFPREKILTRIAQIQAFKEEKGLDELARLLAPEAAPGKVCWDDPTLLSAIGPQGKEFLWKEGGYTFSELVALACGTETIRQGARPQEGKLIVDLVRIAGDVIPEPTGVSVILGEKTLEREGLALRVSFGLIGREPFFLDGESRAKIKLDLEKIVEAVKLTLGGEGRG